MSEYRLYTINELGHVRARALLHCRSDLEAIGLAERRRGGQQMELWQGDRLVRAFAADRRVVEA